MCFVIRCHHAKKCEDYEESSFSCNQGFVKGYCGIQRNWDMNLKDSTNYDDAGYQQ